MEKNCEKMKKSAGKREKIENKCKKRKNLRICAVLDPLPALYLKDSAALGLLTKDSAVSEPPTKDSAACGFKVVLCFRNSAVRGTRTALSLVRRT